MARVIEHRPTKTTRPELKREMGLWTATAMVVGNMIGSGVFLLPAALAAVAIAYGSSILLAWVVTGVGAMLLAGVFATMGGRYPRMGGPYAYARRAFGDFVGFQTAWGYWIAAWVGNAAIATAFVGYTTVIWPSLGDSNLAMAGLAVGAIWLLTFVNALGVRQGGWVQVATTILKFVPLAIIGVIGLFYMVGNHFTPFLVASGSVGRQGLTLVEGITAAIGLTLWAFIGLESATVPAEEVKDPERTIPRATYLGTAVTTLIYIVATVAVMGIIPLAALSESNAPFADAATSIFGGTWGKWVALVGMISAFGALNGWTLLTARISMAASEDGLFPKVFGRVHGTRRTPIYGLVIAAALVTGLVFMNYNESLVNQFTFMLLLATLTTVVPYAFAAAAEIALMIREPERFAGRKLLRDAAVAILGFGYAVWAMYATGSEAIAKGYILLMLGIPIYLYLRWRRQRDRMPLRTELVELPERPLEVAATANGGASQR